jgi:hypothetical protein
VLQANYFDGRSTRVHAVKVTVAGEDLVLVGEDIDLCVPFAKIKVDERLGWAPRRLRFEGGAFCEVRDLNALDTLLSALGYRDKWVDRMQRQMRFVLLAFVVCATFAIAAYKWGLPWAAATGARHLSPALGKTLSAQTLKALDSGILMPSKIPEGRQQALSAAFHAMRLPEGGTATSEPMLLLFPT